MAEKLSPAQQKAINWVKSSRVRDLGALGEEIGKMLAEMAVELADAKQEATHWKSAFQSVRDEILVLVSVAIRRINDGKRLVIGKQEYFDVVKGNVELYCGGEEGVRMYELRERRKQNPAIDGGVKAAVNGKSVVPH